MRLKPDHYKRVAGGHYDGINVEGGSAPDVASGTEVSSSPELKRELSEAELKELWLLGNDRVRIAKKFVDRRMIEVRRVINEFIVHESHTFFPIVGDIKIKLERAITGVHDSTHEKLSKFERAVDAFAALSNAMVYACVLAGETKTGAYASVVTHALTYGVPLSELTFKLAQIGAEKLGEKWAQVVSRIEAAYESMPGIHKAQFFGLEDDLEEVMTE